MGAAFGDELEPRRDLGEVGFGRDFKGGGHSAGLRDVPGLDLAVGVVGVDVEGLPRGDDVVAAELVASSRNSLCRSPR